MRFDPASRPSRNPDKKAGIEGKSRKARPEKRTGEKK
jgi:hypothetical protein